MQKSTQHCKSTILQLKKKLQWDTTLKRRTFTIIGECVDKLALSYIAVGSAVLENVVRKLPQKLNVELPYDPKIPLLVYILYRIENMYLHKNFYMSVSSSVIHNRSKVETT